MSTHNAPLEKLHPRYASCSDNKLKESFVFFQVVLDYSVDCDNSLCNFNLVVIHLIFPLFITFATRYTIFFLQSVFLLVPGNVRFKKKWDKV